MIRRLAAVLRVWATRRLLWVWLFAYACVLTSACFRPISPKGAYFECPPISLPRNAPIQERRVAAKPDAPPLIVSPDDLKAHINIRDLIMRDPLGMRNWSGLRARAPALEQVFVGDFHDDPAGFQRVCQALPGVRVWHLDLNGGRLASTVFLLFATLILGGVVMQQTPATFSLPQARMFPGFGVPHLIIPLAICGAGIAAASFVARKFGTDFWAAAALQALAWGLWSAFEFASVSLRRNLWRFQRSRRPETGPAVEPRAPWFEGVTLILAVVAAYLIFVARPYVLESFLLGELPWLTAGLLTMGVALGIAALVRAPVLPVDLNELGMAPALSLQDLEKRRPSSFLLATPFRRRLAHLRRPNRAATWWWRIRATRCGNPDLLFSTLIRIVAPIAIVAACDKVLAWNAFPQVFVLLLAGVGWIVALSSCFSTWWQRRKAFSVQLLYPWTRRQMTLAAFAAYAIEAAGVLALLLVTVFSCNMALGWRLGTDLMLTGASIVVATASLLVAGGLWLLTLRHRLWASFLAFTGVVIVLGGVYLEWPILTLGGARRVLSVSVLAYVLVASFVGIQAYRRWMHNEWGLLGPP